MGIPPEDDEIWARLMNTTLGAGDPDLNPEGVETVMQRDVPEIFERCGQLIAERRENPTDDLTSVLVHAEIDGERLEEHEIVMGFFLLVAAGNDSTKATYCSAMRALMENPEQRQKLLDDPSLVPSAVEEALRMFPAFAHFRRTATRDTELNGSTIREGEKVVMWYVSSNRDETRYEDPDRFDVDAQPRAPGVRRGRAALLPRHGARAARAEDPARGDARSASPTMELAGDAGATSSRRSSTSSRRCRSGYVRTVDGRAGFGERDLNRALLDASRSSSAAAALPAGGRGAHGRRAGPVRAVDLHRPVVAGRGAWSEGRSRAPWSERRSSRPRSSATRSTWFRPATTGSSRRPPATSRRELLA